MYAIIYAGVRYLAPVTANEMGVILVVCYDVCNFACNLHCISMS